ncbi:hypothetical protein BABINDRAFT_8245 [Babjeviella inositovora NRRL Y-12698]|uniref:Interferon-related developmental regulator N-terminal domain-containing protein n=1 Tax=Babjeviella inositovora NRRL Y-12698 TaxID=984486 RepID=A0A1E3QQV8_9ASCO|nr:uncharacterized protein BABINDRAFT_8245 [Babjeviella inositovora NRRL Y-12698]ODQ80075.1 hypothetical protein BABINDRAFT_8245 [Babjeviella inositovora NRRL Y-12698]
MSDLRRQLFAESPKTSKPLSRSQSRSRVKTPALVDADDTEGELNTQMLDELLLARVNSFQAQFEADETKNTERIKTSSVSEIITSLQLPLKTVSVESRQLLLAQLYKLTVFQPGNPHGEINDVNLELLVRQFVTLSPSNVEETLLITRAISSFAASDIDECATGILEDYFPRLLKLLFDYRNVEVVVRSQLVQSFIVLQLFIYYDAGTNTKTKEYMTRLLELAEDLVVYTGSTDIGGAEEVEHSTFITDVDNKQLQQQLRSRDESQAIIGILHGLGVLFTIIADDNDCNAIIEEFVPRLLVFLENSSGLNIDVQKAAGRVIALLYEIFDYGDSFSPNDEDYFASQSRTGDGEYETEDDDDNLPFYDSDYIVQLCAELATASSKKISRKDKKETHSVFRDISVTLETQTSKRNRFALFKQVLKKLENELPVLGNIALTKSKSLPIRHWFTYVRYIVTKWCFGAGLQTQMVGNSDLKKILRATPPQHGNEGSSKWAQEDTEEGREGRWGDDSAKRGEDKKKREQQLNKDRLDRMREKIDVLDI